MQQTATSILVSPPLPRFIFEIEFEGGNSVCKARLQIGDANRPESSPQFAGRLAVKALYFFRALSMERFNLINRSVKAARFSSRKQFL